MAVIAAKIKLGSWKGTFSENSQVSYTMQVETDDEKDGPITVQGSPLIPQVGMIYDVGNEAAPAYVCKSVQPKVSDKDKRIWEVEITYEIIDLEGGAGTEDPDHPVRVSLKFKIDSLIRYEKVPMLKDLDGKLVQNTAGEQYSAPLEQDIKILVLNITRKEFANPFGTQTAYQNTVNNAVFWGIQPGYVLLESIIVDGEARGTKTSGWNVKYSLAIRPSTADPWDTLKVPSMGYNERTDDGVKEIINKVTGKAYNVEQYLDAVGHWMDRNSAYFQPYIDEYRKLERKLFNALLLPNVSALTYQADPEPASP